MQFFIVNFVTAKVLHSSSEHKYFTVEKLKECVSSVMLAPPILFESMHTHVCTHSHAHMHTYIHVHTLGTSPMFYHVRPQSGKGREEEKAEPEVEQQGIDEEVSKD